jgi:hypothetical protein
MAYGTRPNGIGGQIKTFWPDDTDTEFFLVGGIIGVSLVEIIARAQAKWPNICHSRIRIEAEHIHTDCLGYDLYDAGDYTMFLKISLKD